MGERVFTPNSDRSDFERSLETRPFVVVGFCAAWCNTCGEFKSGFDDIAESRPDGTFVWLDIEDDAELAGDIDVENFPTIAVYHDRRLVHFGVSLPQPAVLLRLLGALSAESETIVAEPALAALVERLAAAPAASSV